MTRHDLILDGILRHSLFFAEAMASDPTWRGRAVHGLLRDQDCRNGALQRPEETFDVDSLQWLGRISHSLSASPDEPAALDLYDIGLKLPIAFDE
jgi:hypothetical protein